MQQTFKKNINGHYIQFNRLLYPLKYTVKNDDEFSDGKQVEIRKEKDGSWSAANNNDSIPDWFNEAFPSIIDAILENESRQFA